VLFETGTTVATDLFGSALAGALVLVPKAFYTAATHPKTLTHLACAFTLFSRTNDALAQILTQGPHDFFLMREIYPTPPQCVYLNRKCSSDMAAPRIRLGNISEMITHVTGASDMA
jgi:hypothetical protein